VTRWNTYPPPPPGGGKEPRPATGPVQLVISCRFLYEFLQLTALGQLINRVPVVDASCSHESETTTTFRASRYLSRRLHQSLPVGSRPLADFCEDAGMIYQRIYGLSFTSPAKGKYLWWLLSLVLGSYRLQ